LVDTSRALGEFDCELGVIGAVEVFDTSVVSELEWLEDVPGEAHPRATS
jgi:hypothetical protein